MKTCIKCNKELSLNQFYLVSSNPVKHKNSCIQCQKLYYLESYRNLNAKQHICKNCKSTFSVNPKYAPNPQFCTPKCHSEFRSLLDYSKTFWTNELQSHIDGLMLSDIGIRTNNCFQWNVQHEEFAKYISNCLNPYAPYIKHYPNVYSGRTRTHPDIKKQRQRWYPNGVKIVPQDVTIDPICLALLYIGDGHIHKVRGNITIATLSFSEEENVFLSEQMNRKFNLHSRVITQKNRYCLYFSRPNAIEFLKTIDKSPIRCYDYKFVVPSKQVYRDYQREYRKRKHEKNKKSIIEAV